jgi:protein SCO1/2
MTTTAQRIASTNLRRRQFVAVAVFIACIAISATTAGALADLPGDSVYHLDIPLVDQDGNGSHLADRRGKPQLVSMFYTSCKFVCPLIIDSLRLTERSFDPAERQRLEVLVLSFDPERDTPTQLKSVFDKRKLDARRWTLARTEAPNVRKLAAALDIRYRALADGDINHATALVFLDADGRIVARSDTLGAVDPDFVAAIRASLSAHAARLDPAAGQR